MTRSTLILILNFLCLVFIATETNSLAQEWVAKVGERTVDRSELNRELKKVIAGKKIDEYSKSIITATAVRQLVRQKLCLLQLKRRKMLPKSTIVNMRLQTLETELARRKETLDDFLATKQISEEKLRESFEWEIGWKKFVDQYLNEKNLQNYFEKNARQFDGTKLAVSQILLKVETDDASNLKTAMEKAQKIHAEIKNGKSGLSFAEAAKKHSQSPSATEGGKIGEIGFDGPMPKSFNDKVMNLKSGEISKPFVTSFGVHLVRCDEVIAGGKRWKECETELRAAMKKYLFKWLAEQELKQTKVEYADISHFQEGTDKLER